MRKKGRRGELADAVSLMGTGSVHTPRNLTPMGASRSVAAVSQAVRSSLGWRHAPGLQNAGKAGAACRKLHDL